MHALTFTGARKHFAETVQRVSDNAEPVRILRRDAPDVIIIGAHEYDAMVETLHLFSNPVNAAISMRLWMNWNAGDIVKIDV